MKTGKYYLGTMSADEQKRFMANMDRHVQSPNFICSEFKDMAEFVMRAFTWKSTPEGQEYWSKIAKRKID